MRKEKTFAYLTASAYHFTSKEVENHIFRHSWNFRHTFMYKQFTLTKCGNYNIFLQIWYSYFRYTDRFFLGYALFVARCSIITASWETKKERFSHRKKYIEEFVWETFLTACPPFLVIFCCFLCLPPLSSQVMYLLNCCYKDAKYCKG